MEITVEVPDELAQQAKARGLSIQAYVQQILSSLANGGSKNRIPQSREEIYAWLDALSQFSDKIPPLPEVISREWIYQERD